VPAVAGSQRSRPKRHLGGTRPAMSGDASLLDEATKAKYLPFHGLHVLYA
jgi:hypothetical protein